MPSTVFNTRPLAVLHVAMFDALNSIDYRYHEYAVRVGAPDGASPEVAAAQAAHDVLAAMIPSQAATYDAALAATVAKVPADAASRGSGIGAAVARAILELREDDGWSRPAQTYLLPNMAGYWQPVPPANAAAAFVHYPDCLPFAVHSRLQFLRSRHRR